MWKAIQENHPVLAGALAGGGTVGLAGAGIGATIGALVFGIPTFGSAAGIGLLLSGLVGGGVGVGLGTAAGAAYKRLKKDKPKRKGNKDQKM